MYIIYVKCILHVSIVWTYTLKAVRINFQYKCLITNRSIYIFQTFKRGTNTIPEPLNIFQFVKAYMKCTGKWSSANIKNNRYRTV